MARSERLRGKRGKAGNDQEELQALVSDAAARAERAKAEVAPQFDSTAVRTQVAEEKLKVVNALRAQGRSAEDIDQLTAEAGFDEGRLEDTLKLHDAETAPSAKASLAKEAQGHLDALMQAAERAIAPTAPAAETPAAPREASPAVAESEPEPAKRVRRRRAGAAKTGAEDVSQELEEVLDTSEVDNHATGARVHWMALAEWLHDHHISTTEIPDSWKLAQNAFLESEAGAEAYKKEKDPEKRKAILRNVERLASLKHWEDINAAVGKDIERLEAAKAPAASPAAEKEEEKKPERARTRVAKEEKAEPKPKKKAAAKTKTAAKTARIRKRKTKEESSATAEEGTEAPVLEPDIANPEALEMNPPKWRSEWREKLREILKGAGQRGLEDDRTPRAGLEPKKMEEKLPPESPEERLRRILAEHGEIGLEPAVAEEIPVASRVHQSSDAPVASPETLESSEPPPGSAAEVMLRPRPAAPTPETQPESVESSPVPEGSAAERMLASLEARSAELDRRAEGLGPAAAFIRKRLDEYNQLGWKKKVLYGSAFCAFGAAGTLTGASALLVAPLIWRGVSAAGSFVLAEGLVQRSREKQERWWNKYPKVYGAVAAALIGSGLFGKAVMGGLNLAADTAAGRAVAEFVKAHAPSWLGSHTPAPAVVPEKAPGSLVTPHEYVEPPGEAPIVPHGVPSPEIPAAPQAVMPVVVVRSGYGAEAMMKDLWRQLHDPSEHLTLPANLDPGSELAQLRDADDTAINGLVHRLALAHPDMIKGGESVVVGRGSVMSFNARGDIVFGNNMNGFEAHAAPRPSVPLPSAELRSPATTILNDEELARIKAGLPPAPPSPTPPEFDRPVRILPHAAEVPASVPDVEPPHAESAPSAPLVQASVPSPEAPEAPFVNAAQVFIDPGKPGIYEYSNGAIMAFGGTFAASLGAAEAYARAHPHIPVWVQGEPEMVDGRMEPRVVSVEYRGFFRGMHMDKQAPGSQAAVINPATFRKRIV